MNLLVINTMLFISASLVVYLFMTSSFDYLDRYSQSLSRTTESNLRKLFVIADVQKVHKLYFACLLSLPVLSWLLGASVLIVLLIAILVLITPYLVFAQMAKRRRASIKSALPDALHQIAGSMQVGTTFSIAVETYTREVSGALSQEFSLLLREQRMGISLEEALENLAERIQSEETDLFASAAMIANEVGGNLAEILQSLSETLRRKIEMEGKIEALTAQGRLQGRVVSALPFLVLIPLLYFESDATLPIFTSLLGWCFLALIVLLDVIGSILINKIVSIDV